MIWRLFCAICASAAAQSAIAEIPTTACAPGQQLTKDEQLVFARFNRTYLVFMRIDDEPREFSINITTPGEGLGDGFPINVCGSDLLMTLPDGSTAHGVMTYEKPDPTEEIRPYPFQVAFVDRPDMKMAFHATFGGQIRGYIRFSETEGYFIGDDVWRWKD